ncbi:MAG: 4-hydroxy-tetrahydrodipicolinate reductase [Planctomycetes bacterium ADurb.Bin126]|nr:MAG: 4-hydroxy-tetrahydrodipicolinate reductase [Planctomycetes bacterium ADurb.Bin126]HOD80900.1 4-hydroxy-tetrahydrodipicolinate reductase [Phycisphaerae bacterium]HQL72249.1 4-hydroxy-tetrahydrodipicolinate reductase [Phycisphaerae bacterium]
MTKIAITGAAGRMGRRIAALAIESEQFDIVDALEVAGHADMGKDVGELAGVGTFGVRVGSELTAQPDVLIDFSLPEGTMRYLPLCREKKVPMVIGTTGLAANQQAEIADAASDMPIVFAANMSVGINVLLKIVGQVARSLGADYDIEISETHHRFKKDAPSGTAIALAKSICDELGKEYGSTVTLGRGGLCPRTPGEIGMHALRLGDTVGEHSVQYGTLGETITISHSAHTRDTFVRGALRAAKWLVGKPPSLYTMADVLGL